MWGSLRRTALFNHLFIEAKLPFFFFSNKVAGVCKIVILTVCSWTSGRRVLQGPVVCVNPLKAVGSLLLWRFQWIFAAA